MKGQNSSCASSLSCSGRWLQGAEQPWDKGMHWPQRLTVFSADPLCSQKGWTVVPAYMAQCTVYRAKSSSLDAAGTEKLWSDLFPILFVVSRQTFANTLSTLPWVTWRAAAAPQDSLRRAVPAVNARDLSSLALWLLENFIKKDGCFYYSQGRANYCSYDHRCFFFCILHCFG